MKQADENFLSMCKAVRDVLAKHTNVWTTNVAFQNQANVFFASMNDLDLAVEQAEIVSTGATENKANAELAAVALAVNLAKRASVYALNQGDMELHDQLRITKRTLMRRPDTLTLAKLRDIHSRLNGIVSQLSDYGVSHSDLADLQIAIVAFDELIARPRVLIVERKGYNQDAIPSLMAELREVLYKMDSLMNIFSGTVLAKSYKDARIIVNLGGSGGTTTPPMIPPTGSM